MDELQKLPRESARQRAQRIPLAYQRTRGVFWLWKMVLSLIGVLAGGFYIAWVLGGGKPAATQVSPGTLARDHARWDSDCKACHVQFVPQRSDADGTRAVSLSLSGAANSAFHRADAKCSHCHKSAGIHHANQIATEVESCASCHRDHQGRDFNMARMDDAHCTVCHASIASHRMPQGSPVNAPLVNVTAFEPRSADGSSGHPPFRSLQKQEDPGNIRFSHRLHMTLGQLYPGQEAPKGKRSMQLACDACHQPETTTGNGAYMRPIKYEQHCRGCHPLNMPGQPESVVPHGLTSQQLESTVRGLLANPKPQTKQPPARIIPGKFKEDSEVGTLLPSEMQLAQRLAQVRDNKCSQCHSWNMLEPNKVLPSRIPATWLQHARFNHQKHQNSAKCLDCHAEAAAKFPVGGTPGKLTDDQQIMIPGIDNCVRCHAPRKEAANTGGARFDCAECHQYHHTPVQAKPLRQKVNSATSAAGWPEPLRLSLVAHQQATNSPPTHTFVGTQSCSTTGCHGGTSKERGSPSSFTRFTANDPHERAFLLLYSDSSRRMIRRLRGEDQPELSEPAYFAALQEKCLGCHATPPPDSAKSSQREGYLTGITCESCHGAAAEWEFTHFQRGAKPSSLTRLSDLPVRATTCAECHIGPMEMLGKSYDVNHDLIAAGHPRLTFEFEANMANLPPHWGAGKDIKSHFEAWKTGELATAGQQGKLYKTRDPLEFASRRCFDCHHSISAAVPPTRRASEGILAGARRDLLSQPAATLQDKKSLLRELLNSTSNSSSSRGTRWEEHVQLSLGLAAYTADYPQDRELVTNVENLTIALAHSSRLVRRGKKSWEEQFFAGGPYDSPTSFDPNDPLLKQILARIQVSLATP